MLLFRYYLRYVNCLYRLNYKKYVTIYEFYNYNISSYIAIKLLNKLKYYIHMTQFIIKNE